MVAVSQDLYVEEGVDKRFTLLWEYEATPGAEDWTPYDLTGCTARLQMRPAPKGDVLLEVTTETADEIVLQPDDVPGLISIHLPHAKTELLERSKAKYDLEVTFPSGDILRVVQGLVTISREITEDAA